MLFHKMTKDAESVIAVCFIFISALYFIGGQNPLLKKSLTGIYGPAFYPNIFASLLLVLSILILVKRYKKCSAVDLQEQNMCKTPKKLIFIFCLTICCPILMSYGGFILMGLVSIFIFCKILSLSTKEAILLSVGLTCGVYMLFDALLKVQLPNGILF